MPQQKKSRLMIAIILAALTAPLVIQATSAPQPNICNIGELWEGQCLRTEEWEAGWYLHPDNDPGDGRAVEVAYGNYPLVIQEMPHSACVDWRTANCNGSIPPTPSVKVSRSSRRSKSVSRERAISPEACAVQANTSSSIDPFCHRFVDYDFSLSQDHADFDESLFQDAITFILDVLSVDDCDRAARAIITRGPDYSAGNLSDESEQELEEYINNVQSWACRTWHRRQPPPIPVSPAAQ